MSQAQRSKKEAPTMTTLAYQQRNQERLAQAIASVQEHEDVFGRYCTVHSTTEKIGIYSVDIDENLYAVSCTCPGNADHGYDCIHMLACDRYYDDRRPSFYEMHGIQKLSKQQSPTPAPKPVQTVPVVEVMAQANAAMVQFDQDCQVDYDTLATTKTTAAQREAKRLEEETKPPTSYNFNSLGYPSGAYRKLDK